MKMGFEWNFYRKLTYFSQKARKGEADIFMMAGGRGNRAQLDIEMMLRDVVSNLDGVYNDFGDNQAVYYSEYVNFLEHSCAVSASIAGDGDRDANAFLKDILRIILRDGVL